MLIALINDQRTKAAPKLKGICPGCSHPVAAKCGVQRAWHWAHISKQDCDSWWEETEWHRMWKGNFPFEWQEVILYDTKSGEKHIADIRTQHRLVIEFQHSPLNIQERIARETFYNNMVWIIDAAHRKNDFKRFAKGFSQSLRTHKPGMFLVPFPEKCFPANWAQSTKPVFFDFRGIDAPVPPDNGRELLWCLLPGRTNNLGVLIALNRNDIIKEATEQADLVEVLLKGHTEAKNFLIISNQPSSQQMAVPLRPRYSPKRGYQRF